MKISDQPFKEGDMIEFISPEDETAFMEDCDPGTKMLKNSLGQMAVYKSCSSSTTYWLDCIIDGELNSINLEDYEYQHFKVSTAKIKASPVRYNEKQHSIRQELVLLSIADESYTTMANGTAVCELLTESGLVVCGIGLPHESEHPPALARSRALEQATIVYIGANIG